MNTIFAVKTPTCRPVLSMLLLAAVASGRAAEPGAGQRGPSAPDVNEPQPFAVLAPRTIPDGRLFAPFYEYVIGPHAVAARNTIYCVFQNAHGQPIAMAYDPGQKRWAGPVKVSEFGMEKDDHGNPALCIDRRGYLHVFYGCHGGPMRHARSGQPYDITAWHEEQSPTPKATYPQVMLMADGSVCLFYRAGGHMEPWTLRISGDDCRSWTPPQPVIEMRKAPPDRLAAAYCFFLPGSGRRSIHAFWNHKDDNAARVTADRPHPWRPLKYPGLHEAVYRYNVYYLRRGEDGAWHNAAGREINLPVSKAEADAQCLVYDSGDEFTGIGLHLAVDAADRPYIRFGTGVVDWVKSHKDPGAVLVPVTDRFAHFAAGKWQVAKEMPADWPAEAVRIVRAPGLLAYGDQWPAGHWFISAERRSNKPEVGCAVSLYHDQNGYAVGNSGAAEVE